MADITDQWFTAVAVNGDYKTMHVWDGDGDINRVFEFNFQGGYINQADIKAFMVHNETQERTDLTITFIGTNMVRLNLAVPVTHKVTIYRDTNKVEPLAKFADGAIITAKNLDRNAKQAIFAVAEMVDRFDSVTATADEAIAVAYAARDTANSALVKSENALYTSGIALDASNAAQTAALNAQTASAAAVATANQASTVANGIAATANTALSTSQAAVNTANGIDAKATQALTNSNTAITTANEARTTANGIDAKATTALANSATAVNTANAANTTANNALTTANNAVTQGAALNRAVTDVDAASERVVWKYRMCLPQGKPYEVINTVGNAVEILGMSAENRVGVGSGTYPLDLNSNSYIQTNHGMNLGGTDGLTVQGGGLSVTGNSDFYVDSSQIESGFIVRGTRTDTNAQGITVATGAGGRPCLEGRAGGYSKWWLGVSNIGNISANVRLSGTINSIDLMDSGDIHLTPQNGKSVRIASQNPSLFLGVGNTRMAPDGNIVGTVWGGTGNEPGNLKTYIDTSLAKAGWKSVWEGVSSEAGARLALSEDVRFRTIWIRISGRATYNAFPVGDDGSYHIASDGGWLKFSIAQSGRVFVHELDSYSIPDQIMVQIK